VGGSGGVGGRGADGDDGDDGGGGGDSDDSGPISEPSAAASKRFVLEQVVLVRDQWRPSGKDKRAMQIYQLNKKSSPATNNGRKMKCADKMIALVTTMCAATPHEVYWIARTATPAEWSEFIMPIMVEVQVELVTSHHSLYHRQYVSQLMSTLSVTSYVCKSLSPGLTIDAAVMHISSEYKEEAEGQWAHDWLYESSVYSTNNIDAFRVCVRVCVCVCVTVAQNT